MQAKRLGRGLISAQPDADRCQLDEGEVIGSEFVVTGGDTPTLLDLVEEPLDEVARAIQVRAKTNRLFSIALRPNVSPRALLTDERPEPVSVISPICQQH